MYLKGARKVELQRVATTILHDKIHKEVEVYVDDTIVKSKEREGVDTPFLTVLKTWTSPLEHSVIIHVCVHLEFPEASATRLAAESLNSTVLCLGLHQSLVFLLWRAWNGFWDIPTLHSPWL